jgi:hypothetical protein
MLPSSRPEYVVVISGPAFSYRLTNYLFGVLPGIAAILLARFLMGSLSSALGRLFGDIGASVGTVVAGLAMLAALLFCFASVVVGWDDVRSRAIYEVSKRGAKYSNVMGAKLYDFELALVDVISVKVVQGRVGRFFNYGELVFVTREQAEALRFAGVAEPYAVKERVDEVLRHPSPAPADVSPLPKPDTASPPKPALTPAPVKGVVAALIIIAVVALLAWLIMPPTIDVHPGESRKVFLEADYLVTHGDIGWTDADTQNLNIEVGTPDTIRVSVDSIKATITKIGEGQSVGFQYMATIEVAPEALRGEASVYIRITHPKLMGPSVSQPPIRKIRVRINK